MESLSKLFHLILDALINFYTKEIPKILNLSANTLTNINKILINQKESLSIEQWIKLSPIITCLIFISSLPFFMLYNTKVKSKYEQIMSERKNSFWMTRLLIQRMTGLILFSAFITLAFQGKGLFTLRKYF